MGFDAGGQLGLGITTGQGIDNANGGNGLLGASASWLRFVIQRPDVTGLSTRQSRESGGLRFRGDDHTGGNRSGGSRAMET